MPPSTDGLVVEGVGVRFGGVVALSDVSLRVPPGRIVAVIGPNGAGKTTLFNVICGFVRPRTGTLLLDGVVLRPRPDRLARLGIARTMQGIGLFPSLTVVENVMTAAAASARLRGGLPAALLGLPSARADERHLRAIAVEALGSFGLAEHAEALPETLPYALRKRVALARALVTRPRLLLLDEPAGGLDAAEIAELTQVIRGLGISVLLVEHQLDVVMSLCDHIVVLDLGRVVATGTPAEVRDDPAVAEAYLGVTS